MAVNLNPAQKRYIRRFIPTMMLYVVVLMACTLTIDRIQPQGPMLFLLSVLPALPIVAVIAVMGIYLSEERDEFIRHRLVVSMIAGMGILLSLLSVWGFLENQNVVPHFPTMLAFPIWCGAFGLVQGVLAMIDRRAERAS